MEIQRKLTERLKGILEYNPITGEFFWKLPYGSSHVGDVAGSVYPNGYRYIQIDGLDYRAGRLAWFFVTGEDPIDFIDHKNKDRDDNSFDNLRVATNSQNQANAFWKTNTSGFKGVCWQADRKKWMAKITINNHAINLGRYHKFAEAALAYRAAAIDAWGEFALVPSEEEIGAMAPIMDKHKKFVSEPAVATSEELGL